MLDIEAVIRLSQPAPLDIQPIVMVMEAQFCRDCFKVFYISGACFSLSIEILIVVRGQEALKQISNNSGTPRCDGGCLFQLL